MTKYKSTAEGDVQLTPEEEAEWDALHTQLRNEISKTEYKQKRAIEYPAIGDQLDALFKAGVFPADMAATIQAIKDKYPKGTA